MSAFWAGSLEQITGFPFTTDYPTDFTVATPDSKYLFVADASQAKVTAFSIDPLTAALAIVPGAPFDTGGPHQYMATHPDSSYLYVTAGSAPNNLAVLKIDGASRGLSPVNGSPYTVGNNLGIPTVAGNGKFLYVPGADTGLLYGLAIDPDTGELTPLSPESIPVGNVPFRVSATTNQQRIYTASKNEIYGFDVNADTGALSALPGSPYATLPVTYYDLFIHPGGEYLFAPPGIDLFSIDPITGALSDGGQSVTLSSGYAFSHMSTDGNYLFAIKWGSPSDMLAAYEFDPTTGTADQHPQSPISLGGAGDGTLTSVVFPTR